MGFEVDDLDAVVADLRRRGVVFEVVDHPGYGPATGSPRSRATTRASAARASAPPGSATARGMCSASANSCPEAALGSAHEPIRAGRLRLHEPDSELLERTTNPLHRAILLNFWRHVHLEGAGEYEKILAPDMMVEHPVYRVTWGANPAVIEGKEGVLGSTTASAKRCCGTPTTAWRSPTGGSAMRSPSTSSRRAPT